MAPTGPVLPVCRRSIRPGSWPAARCRTGSPACRRCAGSGGARCPAALPVRSAVGDRGQERPRPLADVQRRRHDVHRPAAQDGDRRQRLVAEGPPQRGHRLVQRAVAAVHADDGRRLAVQTRRRSLSSSASDFGASTRPRSPISAWNSAAMRGSRRLARDRGLTMTATVSLTRRRSRRRLRRRLADSPDSAAHLRRSLHVILGYQRSNTSVICRACFSFEMLNDDCLR